MDKFTTLEGVAAPLKQINVDTNMIIPQAISEDNQAHRARQGPVRGAAVS